MKFNSVINRTFDTTRHISHDLLPLTLEEFGLIEALKELKDNYHQTGILFIRFNMLSEGENLDNKFKTLNLCKNIVGLIVNALRNEVVKLKRDI